MARKAHPPIQSCKSMNRLLAEQPLFILFDTETTGLSAASCRIIEISALKIRSRDLQVVDELTVYIRPPEPVPREIEALTGITNSFLENCPGEDEVFGRIRDFFGDGIVCGAYNTGFDRSFMEALYGRHGADFVTGREFFDVLKMARELVAPGETENFRLASMVAYFRLNEDKSLRFHDAKDDALATYHLFCRLYREYLARPLEAGGGMKPQIQTIQSWSRYQCRRIYVNLKSPRGTVYYDLKESCWQNKERDVDLLSLIDTDALRKELLLRTGAASEAELWDFEGRA